MNHRADNLTGQQDGIESLSESALGLADVIPVLRLIGNMADSARVQLVETGLALSRGDGLAMRKALNGLVRQTGRATMNARSSIRDIGLSLAKLDKCGETRGLLDSLREVERAASEAQRKIGELDRFLNQLEQTIARCVCSDGANLEGRSRSGTEGA
jgi:hypothetical protein